MATVTKTVTTTHIAHISPLTQTPSSSLTPSPSRSFSTHRESRRKTSSMAPTCPPLPSLAATTFTPTSTLLNPSTPFIAIEDGVLEKGEADFNALNEKM
ncbi:hypothetical protein L1049_022839 [Liquidambar formosana]|uniref:Uncharacterized protein n=1 Tax=Liquidambar formosana TaxID=63359 RepID=A0AAP0WP84_LIQFO